MRRRNESHAVRRQGVVEVRAYETADVAAMAEVWNEVVRDGVAQQEYVNKVAMG